MRGKATVNPKNFADVGWSFLYIRQYYLGILMRQTTSLGSRPRPKFPVSENPFIEEGSKQP